jgi:hypothetical protein
LFGCVRENCNRRAASGYPNVWANAQRSGGGEGSNGQDDGRAADGDSEESGSNTLEIKGDRAMTNIDELKFYTGPYGENRWLALSFNSPYLCFEAESEQALLAKCRKAIAICRKALAHAATVKRERNLQPFQPTKVISAKELEAA